MNEAELLFTQILGCDRLSLYLNQDTPLGKDKISLISSVLKRRISGEPLQYILGKAEFMGLEFKVNKEVFIPRPETEILVETAIEIARRLSVMDDRLKILDIGTGSGCIAVSLAKFMRGVEVIATDISDKALEIAKQNARLNNVEVNFLQSDLFSAFSFQLSAFSLIISNLPYIPIAKIDSLQPELSYEPRIALDGGKDGLDFYRRIIRQAPAYLKEGGLLILEMGFGQRGLIEGILKNSKNFQIIEIVKDYNQIDRIIIAKKEEKNG